MAFDLSAELSAIIVQLVPLKHRSRVFELISQKIMTLLSPRFVVVFPSSYGFRQRFLHYSPIFAGDIPTQLMSFEYEKHLESLLPTISNTPILEAMLFPKSLSDFLPHFSLEESFLCVQVRTRNTFHGIILIGPPKSKSDFSENELNFLSVLCAELVLVFERILSLEDLEEANRQLGRFNSQLQKKMNTQAVELNQAKLLHRHEARYKTDFLAKITHDLRTPLQVIRGLTQAMILKEIDPPQVPNAVALLGGSVDRLRHLLDDILNFDAPPTSHHLIDYTQVELRAFFGEIDQTLSHLLKGKPVQYEVMHHHSLESRYFLDAVKVNQLIMNLLSNSIKHTSSGRIGLSTWIRDGDSPKPVLEICIKDTGCGISDALHPYLFEPLTDHASEVTGWGLGLSICVDIISLLGGQIWVDVTADVGTRVHFHVPMHHSHVGLPMVMLAKEAVFPHPDYRQLSVLLCDDDLLNREYASLLLKDEFQLHIVDSGAAAIEAARQNHYDLILMDIRMPMFNGIDALSCIKKIQGWIPCPIVALTAQAMSGDRERCLSYGFDDYLSKPATLQDILQCISRLCLGNAL